MGTVLDNERLGSIYSEFKKNLINFSNSEWSIREYVIKVNPQFFEFIQAQGQNIVDILNHIERLEVRDQRSLLSNMQMGTSLVRGLFYYINFQKDDGEKLTKDETIKVMAEISQLMVAIISCLNNMKVDCFFKEVKFLGKEAREYNNFIQAIERIEEAETSICTKSEDAAKLLENMELTEKAILRAGLAKAFQNRSRQLSARILGLDVLNYTSLFFIFLLTIGVVVNLESFNLFTFLELKNIEVYERFLIIIPLVFFSWFVSKRSQFLYQIREEYLYKQTSALAYEAYKGEAEKNEAMLTRLLEVTIDNLARSPLEQFDKNTDHEPYTQFIREFRKQDK